MIKPFSVSTLTFYTFFSLSLSTPALADASSGAIAAAQTEEHVLADIDTTALYDAPTPYSAPTFEQSDFEWGWTDETRKEVKEQLNVWANNMNDWFGEPDPKKPATASLRVVLDSRWANDPIEGSDVTLEPRIRGRLRLPVLEERLSLIIGDGDLDEDTFLKQGTAGQTSPAIGNQDRLIDSRRVRDDNASIALRWSRFDDQIEDKLGVKTDIDFGVRSVDDLYIKISVDKDWYEGERLKISNDNFYRYGLDSEHYVRGGLNLQFGSRTDQFIDNRTTIRYRNQGDEESADWSNDLRQVHYFGNNKQLAYGASISGYFADDKETLNSYGPAISYRQPIWREWFFVQTELNYYNDKTENKNHYPSALLRLEALF